ncbi:MAG: DNA-binding protein [Candidatus Omnitrophica bacterium]|jgi:hypothetical protein|nr:DNA-binding protein [Candidatus Omnitrophota bacterium]MDD5080042.1 DNA-binding protein [Candidatus Omnitrophota bacterium]MDD5775650.1 DNA-binding protein [Candidatus Omnitrophota bacterium]
MPGSKKKVFFLIFVLGALIFYKSAYAQVVSSADLIRRAKEYDGKSVVYQGEVIGDKMSRGKFVWINVHDGDNALGVWASEELAGNIRVTGAYKHRGDIIRVSGIFNRSCQKHGGDLDIHAQAIDKVSDGIKVKEKISVVKARLVLILAGLSGLIWILIRLKQR